MMIRLYVPLLATLGFIAACSGPRQPNPGAGTTGAAAGETTSPTVPPAAPADTTRTSSAAAHGGILSGDWMLKSIPGHTIMLPENAKPATITFSDGDTRVSGDAGCNRFSGPYMQSGSSLAFGALVSTKRACAEDALNRRETAFLAALSATRRYSVNGSRLVLFGDTGPVAELERGGQSR